MDVSIVFNAETGRYVANVQNAEKATASAAEAVAAAKNKILDSFKAQTDAAQKTGASQQELGRIGEKAAGSLANVTEKNADRILKSLDRISERNKQVAAELANLPTPKSSSHQEGLSTKQASSAVLRGGGLRADENFLASIPGVAAKLQPVAMALGAAGLVGLVVEFGEKGVQAFEKVQHATEATRAAFDEVHQKAQIGIDDLAIENQKLQDQIDKLSGHPNDGLASALLADKNRADELISSLVEARKQEAALFKEQDTGKFGAAMSFLGIGPKDTKGQETELLGNLDTANKDVDKAEDTYRSETAGVKDSKKIKEATDRRNNAVHAAFQSQIDTLSRERGRLKKEQSDSEKDFNDSAGSELGASGIAVDNSRKVANVEGTIKALQVHQQRSDFINSITARSEKVGALNQKKELGSDSDKAAEKLLRSLEAGRKAEEAEGNLGAQADLDYWTGKIAKFKQGSSEYASVQGKMLSDQAALARSREQYAAEVAKGSENSAKNAGALQLANIQLELASHLITRTEADQRAAGVQTAEYTGKIAALRAELAGLNADKSVTPEDKRTRGLGITNQISDLQGQMATQAQVNAARQVSAAEEVTHALREQADAVAALGAVNAKNADEMAQIVTAHELATGAISKNDAATRLAAIHTAEYDAQIAKLKADRANIDADQSMTGQQRETALTRNDAQVATAQGDYDRTSQQDQWNEFSTTGLGGAVTALQKFVAAADDTSGQLESIVTGSLKGINDVLLKEIGTRNYNGVDFRRDLKNYGAGEARNIADVGLEKGEAALMNPALKALGLDSKTKPTGSNSNPFYVRVLNAITGHDGGASAGGGAMAQAAEAVRSAKPAISDVLNTRAMPAQVLSGPAISTQALGQMLYPNGVGDSSASAASAALQPSMTMSPADMSAMLYPNGAPEASSAVTAAPAASSDALSFVNGPAQQPGSTTSAAVPAPGWAKFLGNAINTATGIGLKMLPGFAEGTPPLGSDTMALVGERGPEILNLKAGTSVTPNGKWQGALGGGGATHNWNIDARGSNDPAAVRAQVMQGIKEAAPHIIAASAKHVSDTRKRGPATRG